LTGHIKEVAKPPFKLEDARVAANNLAARFAALAKKQVSLVILVTQYDYGIEEIPQSVRHPTMMVI
jgi:hypothetical protein